MGKQKFKISWQRYKLKASLDKLNAPEVIALIQGEELLPVSRFHGLMSSLVIFIILMICLQSG